MRRGDQTRPGRHRRRRGAVAVEMAIILPLFVTIVLGCLDFARFLYYYVGVVNAARAGAAYGIMNNYTSSTKSTWTTNAGTTGQAEMTGMTGLNSNQLTLSVTSVIDTSTGYNTVTSTATYPFKTITKWPLFPNTVTMTQSVQMRAIR
jgi:Flp pilus assembly protein TadG